MKRCKLPAVYFYCIRYDSALNFARCKQHAVRPNKDFIILSEDEYQVLEILES
jgi:hypothetical protein